MIWLLVGLVVGAIFGALIVGRLQVAREQKEEPTVYASFEEAAEAVVNAVNEMYPIAPEERWKYVEYVEQALREDTGGILRRCDYLQGRYVIEYLNGVGFLTMRVSLDLLFPKTMAVINTQK